MTFQKGNQLGKTNKGRKRPDVSKRMKENNPMNNSENIEKMKSSVSEKIKQGWINPGRFFKGMIGTNTGKKFTKKHKEGISQSNVGKHNHKDENNPNWKGNNVKYIGIHGWIGRKLKRPKNCYVCSSDKFKIEFANISGKYKRDLNDWLPLCKSCHYKFDRKSKYTPEELIEFEDHITDLFNQGKIRSPVHLSGGDEKERIKIFNLIERTDVVYSTYRSHYDTLLHGISKKWLLDWVMKNKSIHVMHKNPHLISSAIVGGGLAPAVGYALSIKLKKEKNRVWCFIGDMTATTGMFWECYNYAIKEDLPIVFVIADNGLSTDTDTKDVWGMKPEDKHWFEEKPLLKIIYYKFKRTREHYGTGKFVSALWSNKTDVKSKGF